MTESIPASLVFVHAFPLNGAMWRRQVAALAEGRRVLAPDLRGFGANAGDAPASLDAHADDLAALLDRERIERAVLVGLSMGGYVAFAMLRRHRARIAGLVLADTRPQADSDEARAAREANARLVESQGIAALVEKLLPGLLSPNAPEAVREEVRRIAAANRPAGVAAALRAMAARPDSTDLLPTIGVPTLVVAGAEDSLTPPDVARAMAAAIPGAGYVEIAGAGHLSNLEQPEAFTAALRAFLEGPAAHRIPG
jgi:pimeloyl-ACP methyl ester carboxylesterase